jgi:hypothetical protein
MAIAFNRASCNRACNSLQLANPHTCACQMTAPPPLSASCWLTGSAQQSERYSVMKGRVDSRSPRRLKSCHFYRGFRAPGPCAPPTVQTTPAARSFDGPCLEGGCARPGEGWTALAGSRSSRLRRPVILSSAQHRCLGSAPNESRPCTCRDKQEGIRRHKSYLITPPQELRQREHATTLTGAGCSWVWCEQRPRNSPLWWRSGLVAVANTHAERRSHDACGLHPCHPHLRP